MQMSIAAIILFSLGSWMHSGYLELGQSAPVVDWINGSEAEWTDSSFTRAPMDLDLFSIGNLIEDWESIANIESIVDEEEASLMESLSSSETATVPFDICSLLFNALSKRTVVDDAATRAKNAYDYSLEEQYGILGARWATPSETASFYLGLFAEYGRTNALERVWQKNPVQFREICRTSSVLYLSASHERWDSIRWLDSKELLDSVSCGPDGMTFLFGAIESGSMEMLNKALAVGGTNALSIPNENGLFPLGFAAQGLFWGRSPLIVRRLLDTGADRDAKNGPTGFTASQLARIPPNDARIPLVFQMAVSSAIQEMLHHGNAFEGILADADFGSRTSFPRLVCSRLPDTSLRSPSIIVVLLDCLDRSYSGASLRMYWRMDERFRSYDRIGPVVERNARRIANDTSYSFLTRLSARLILIDIDRTTQDNPR